MYKSKKSYLKQSLISLIFIAAILVVTQSCQSPQGISKELWGEVDGKQVWLYTITNNSGASIQLTNYGGIITSIKVPDRDGKLDDVVLGFDNLQQYLDPNPCFGATIGRFANRIKNAEFTIDSIRYELEKNNGNNCSHGANEFDRTTWDSEIVHEEKGEGVRFHYLSPDGSHGFPGNLDVYATYLFNDQNEVYIRFEAETDKATHVNLTQHSYFNLNGVKAPIYEHLIKIDADNYTAIDEEIVPTGEISTVKNTDWDLTSLTRMGDNIHKLDFNGYHYCYVFNKEVGEMKKVIEVVEPVTGRTMEVITTQPGVQFYSGNSISDQLVGKYGIKYGNHMAFCLETEHLPNTPNLENFPSTLIRPGQKYQEEVVYKFGVQ